MNGGMSGSRSIESRAVVARGVGIERHLGNGERENCMKGEGFTYLQKT